MRLAFECFSDPFESSVDDNSVTHLRQAVVTYKARQMGVLVQPNIVCGRARACTAQEECAPVPS